MGSLSLGHWLIVLVIVVLVFGTRKLRNLGSDLGGAVKGFKEGIKNGDEEEKSSPPQQTGAQTIEGEVKDNTHTKP